MGVYIKGLKMPRWCNECKFHYWRDSLCEITNKEVDDDASMRGVQPWCPLIELPDHPAEGEIDKWWELSETVNAERREE